MSRARDGMNLAALTRLLGGRPPRESASQPMATAASGAGGGSASRPIDWKSPDESLTLYEDVTDAGALIWMRESCGAEVKISINAAGEPRIRIIDCTGAGVLITPAGIAEVQVDNPGTETESETTTAPAAGWITITGCVNGVDRSIRVIGEVLS